jgi:membrane-bound lytic murein transglycosylase MltF
MNSKKSLAFFVCLLVTILLTICCLLIVFIHNEKKRDLPEIMQEKVLNIVAGYNSIDSVSDGSKVGLHHELGKYIGKRSGLTVQIFFENDLNVSIKKLKKNTNEIIAKEIPITF